MKMHGSSIFKIIFMLVWTLIGFGISGVALSQVPFPLSLAVLFFPIIGIIMLVVSIVNYKKQKNNQATITEEKPLGDFNHLNYTVISNNQNSDTTFTSTTDFTPSTPKNGNIFAGIFLMFFGIFWTSIVSFGISMIKKTEQAPIPVIILLGFFVLIGVAVFILGIFMLVSAIIKTKKTKQNSPISNSETALTSDPAKVYCNYCGHEMSANEKFCTNCGAKKID